MHSNISESRSSLTLPKIEITSCEVILAPQKDITWSKTLNASLNAPPTDL